MISEPQSTLLLYYKPFSPFDFLTFLLYKPPAMQAKIFGTDGVRGRANCPPMDSETALQLGRAVSAVFRNGSHRHRIVIGKDTRLSGYMLETALASGIVSTGTDVLLVGPLPTPGVAFITREMRADAGVVISGSHNNFRDNGIKFFDRDGFKLSTEVEHKIEQHFFNTETNGRAKADQVGRAIRIDDATGRYIQSLKGAFPAKASLDGLKIVVDCSNGAGYRVAPQVLEELGAEVHTLAATPDGTNINHQCGSLHTELMCRTVREVGADLGIALDGDADRVILCDEHGVVVDGDVIMALCGTHWKQKGLLKKSTIVATVMSNLALDKAMQERGIQVLRADVGDRYVVEEMRRNGCNIGGEQSGHMIFLDYNTTGDGMLGALQVLAILLKENKPLSELRKIFEPYPQVLRNIPVKEKRDFQTEPEIAAAMTLIQKELGEKGRRFVRYSGTENLARIMIEGPELSRIESFADELSLLFQKKLGV